MVSVIIPAYNEEKNVKKLHERLVAVLKKTGRPFEVIFVESKSTDGTPELLKKLSPVTAILMYDGGQTAAIDAGIQAAKGDIIFTIDADLQNDPDDIPAMLNKMDEGYDVVVGWRKDRHDSFGRRIFSRFANWITRSIAGLDIHDYGCALRAFRGEYLKNIRLYGVMHVFIPVILAGRGARITEMPVRHYERQFGVSKYSFLHMASDVADLLTIKFLYNYASRPFLFFGVWSLVSFGIALIAVIAAFIIKFLGILGFTQTPLPIIAGLFITLGVLLLTIGFLTELLIRIYYEGRDQTPYRIKEIIENK